MAKITVYKNSKFATTLSFLGYIIIAGGVYAIFNDEPLGGVIALAVGFVVKFLAAFVSKKKREKDAKFDQWMKS